ncbi:penicillin acylase family protein [Halobacillus litoralis]|uniref:penicillin acylase family protein n=1 Tax=Halobacillus litoralis TaxID=45668 RepID=UPI001CD4128E|nr:penicillin acylase family protein [Halobacillus litoralis]MCA0969509.1 penicillin acylase family protein [Halobacillus litoralis]
METAKRWEDAKVKKRWWKSYWVIGAGVIILFVLAALLFVNGYINRTLPKVEGEISLSGLTQQVTVTRDEQGVPHIQAANPHDLFMAQGYIQAQDRLFQMELARRQASGTLSEVVGEATVDQDKYFRALGLRRAAEKSLSEYSEDSLDVLQAYADGVNAYIDQSKAARRLPPEFLLMGIEPSKWEPVDSLTVGKYMAFDLGGHWERQAFNYYLLSQFPEQQAYELFPSYPEGAPTILPQVNKVDVARSFQHAVTPNPFNGSNNWVVSGELTASKAPLLADDPHLGLATPSIWYQMHLQSPEYNVSGVIFAGIPGIILGHNDDVAWGVTNVGPDVQQLYLEKRNPDNDREFLFEDRWEEAIVHQEPIRVKDGETVDYEVVETRNGPIISEFAEQSGEDTVMSLRWTALDATTELEAVLEINRASNWNEFEKGLEKFLAPAQNFVFASSDGTIAYKANGRIPIYETPDDALLPMRGWEEEDQWSGYIPFDELPRTVNPEKGFVATANNKVTEDDYKYHISHNWAQPYRYQRISEMLQERDQLTVEDFKEIQMDTYNLQAQEFLPFFIENVFGGDLSETEQTALQLLEEWDYNDQHSKPQPLLFHQWMKDLQAVLYDDFIDEGMDHLFHGKGQTTDEMLRSVREGENSVWMEQSGGIERVVTDSFHQAVRSLSEKYGGEVADWSWGDVHAVEFTHPLSSISFLERFYNPGDPLPVDGSSVTVRAAGSGEDGLVDHGASWRFIIDLSDQTTGHHIVGPGQSGHFRSEWYHDQLKDWVDGAYHATSTRNFKGNELILKP